MTPIISPWWFYLFDMVEKLGVTSTVIAVLLGIGGVIYFIIWGICEGNEIKFSKILIVIFAISSFLAVFTPSKETCYQMAAASLVTPDNLTTAGNTATDIIDYIVDSIDEILDDEEEE